jgi:hypothetical protein
MMLHASAASVLALTLLPEFNVLGSFCTPESLVACTSGDGDNGVTAASSCA